MTKIPDYVVEGALSVKTEQCPEGLQYVLIRGLHAIGFQQCSAETWNLLRAAGEVFVAWERERIRGLMEKSHRAFSPFVFEAKAYDPPEDDDNQLLYGKHHLTIGHLRNARDAYDAILTELGGQSIRARSAPEKE